jgi:hypothetical protein
MTLKHTTVLAIVTLFLSAASALAQQNNDMGGMNMSGMKMPMDASSSGAKATASVGKLQISDGFVRAMLPGQPVGGGYLTIQNGGSTDDKLISVTSAGAGKVELHEMKMENNIMKMRELKDGIAVPAGSTVKLSPNNMHMMFKQVKTPFKQGATVPVTLIFEKAGPVNVTLPVLSVQGN